MIRHKFSILAVDDQQLNLKILQGYLADGGYEVRVAMSGEAALEALQELPSDLVLLDVSMPGMNGFETCERIKTFPELKDVPIIFLSASDEVNDKVKGFLSGGVDYVTKPFQKAELMARVETHLALRNIQRELEDRNLQLEQEISTRRLMEDMLKRMAMTDYLTGLYNRRHFFDIAQSEIERCRRYKTPVSIIMMDIDHFKLVNDKYGHATGDLVLQVVAKQCRSILRGSDIVVRYGGEEFVALLPNTDAGQAFTAAERLRSNIETTDIIAEGGSLRVTISVGCVGYNGEEAVTVDELVNKADQALYQAKQAGRNRSIQYT